MPISRSPRCWNRRCQHDLRNRVARQRAKQHHHRTLAGQVVMEGFMHWRICRGPANHHPHACDLPAVIIIGLRGAGSVNDLLVLSQVVLALQLPFAMFPLLQFTSSSGAWENGRLVGSCSLPDDQRDYHNSHGCLCPAGFNPRRGACDSRSLTVKNELLVGSVARIFSMA